MTKNEFITTTSSKLLCAAVSSGNRVFTEDVVKAAVELAKELEKMGVSPWMSPGPDR